MSDEPTQHPDPEPEGTKFWVEDRSDLDHAIDFYFEIPVIVGDKMPEWSIVRRVCENGCCQHTILADSVNEETYLVETTPTFIVEMTEVMGGTMPDCSRQHLIRRIAALN